MADEPESEEARKKRESYRANIVKEIVTSEERYVGSLKTLVDYYCTPLLQAIKEDPRSAVIPQNVYDSIFQNINLIASFNAQLLHGLQNMEDPDQVGLIFQQFAPFLKMYTAYTDNSEEAMNTVRTLMAKDTPGLVNLMSKNSKLDLSRLGIRKSFKEWCSTGDREQKEKLESLLIQPVQRVPRYRMLLAELLKFTSKTNKDYNRIESALKTVTVAAAHCNEGLRARQREQERAALLARFPKQLKWTSKSLENRQIVLEEVMFKIDRKGTCRPNVVILFNDLLGYGKGTKGGEVDFSHVLDLKKMTVGNREEFTDPKGNLYKFCFQIETPKKSFALAAPTEDVRSRWVKSIRDAIGVDAVATKKAPIWEPDKKNCSVCGEDFSIFTGKRRHHCRNCGICVCASCSPFNVVLSYIGDTKPQRICTRCYPKICFSDRVERFYAQWDATKLQQPGWLDGIVAENYDRKDAFMAELVARFGPEPENNASPTALPGASPSSPGAGSPSSAAASPSSSSSSSSSLTAAAVASKAGTPRTARSMTVSSGSGMENVQALQSMAVNLESEKAALVRIGLGDDDGGGSGSGGSSGGDKAGEQKTDEQHRAEALADTTAVEDAADTLRWDERLWMFFRFYDPAELTQDTHFVAKVLMQCPTQANRQQLMRGLEQKYGPESAARNNLMSSIMSGADGSAAGGGGAVDVVAASDSESESDADAVDASIW